MSLFANHAIGFPIPYKIAQLDDCRAFLNGYSILDPATPPYTVIALAPLFLTPLAGVKVATVPII